MSSSESRERAHVVPQVRLDDSGYGFLSAERQRRQLDCTRLLEFADYSKFAGGVDDRSSAAFSTGEGRYHSAGSSLCRGLGGKPAAGLLGVSQFVRQ